MILQMVFDGDTDQYIKAYMLANMSHYGLVLFHSFLCRDSHALDC